MIKDVLPFNEAFSRSKARPILYKDKVVHMCLRLPLDTESAFNIEFLSYKTPPEHALILIGDNCRIKSGGVERKQGHIWASVFGVKPFEFNVVKIKGNAFLNVLNGTSSEVGQSTNTWGNYGMVLELEHPNVILARCSSGMMPRLPDFETLVFRITQITGDCRFNELFADFGGKDI